jgi:RNA polymerase sigma-70 factor (ECF subfamily)
LRPNNIETSYFESEEIKSFETVFSAYYPALVSYANTLVKDMDEAEDLVQQVYIRLWEKRESIEIHTSQRAFLYKAVYHACLNRIKQQKVRSNFAQTIPIYAHVDFEYEKLEQKELRKRLDAAIDLLPEQCGKIFKMSRYEHLKYQEIAEQLGLSIKTVENQMGKALKILRQQLKEYLPLLIIFLMK